MKYGILVKSKDNPAVQGYDSAGFYQWLNVFHGQIIGEAELGNLRDGDYDIVHIRLARENLPLIHQLKERLGEALQTKIVASLDIPVGYWEAEFDHPDQLTAAARKADFVFATDFYIAQALAESTGRNVYEISHPVNLENLRVFRNIEKTGTVTILNGDPKNVLQYIRWIKIIFGAKLHVRVLSYRYENPVEIKFYRRKKIEFIICQKEEELCHKLAESQFILVPEPRSCYKNEYHTDENLVVYSAVLGAVVLGNRHLEAMRRCYADIVNAPLRNSLLFYALIKRDAVKINHLIENAQIKAEYYNWGNLQKRFLDILYHQTLDERFQSLNMKMEHPSIFQQIHHVHGLRTIHYDKEQFVVVCLVKNGAEYIKTFIGHYNHLGAVHFFFVDNGSTDETIALLKQYPNITIYKTMLPHKNYESEIRRAVIEEHCMNNWCLFVDIDELFDYPYSDRVSMQQFLRYLNSHQYTAVFSYLLDMFSREIEFSNESVGDEEDIVSKYCFYDISNIKKSRYNSSFMAFTNHNRLSDKKMKNYSGGIRRNMFRSKRGGYLLTKHPLIFVNSKTEPVVHPHFCNKVFIADVNGVLKHYKFIASFKNKVIDSLKSQESYCFYTKQEYKQYYQAIKDKNKLNLYSSKAEKLENIEQLVRRGFLRVSKAYRAYLEQADLQANQCQNVPGQDVLDGGSR
jgi:hypothetical protein